ncbi:UDP-N-acetylmuramoyl-L-alanyl-D-glutamate--2,6-diaminopimelate ligase [Facklamia miroungae]|uniref:UDP-N-acetylmuramoyl-L-alanyl-D-glutamate--2,6-diaminopimelate ligase n=1 Tax=Facklamia miroungae TaxID=120956 RepID=A0A1G7TTM8_9LACT|nr:UDP-N-acetylmuramoyl-L-alanyl-D-glutamate--2,6-diaminopimelate ligase [Facklamia miroungae]NKZ29966.1 UDP-N-acetylmuramoyl-L-alanyl-D-glutamate--2,6-diaminopimelate ligase [Facklamia miroungae]SDG38627.1 UDP-N-acetylmuramoyl-L-alanyl-D-glutamate--2,6-diaminopimelate ligase [Facklamia miroungae]
MQVKELISVLINYQTAGDLNLDKAVVDITNDSRKVVEQGAFIAIKGERFDGHSIISQLIKQKLSLIVAEFFSSEQLQLAEKLKVTLVKVPSTYRAQAILSHQFFGRPSSQLPLVAVTGTNGKTTTTHLISQLLELLGHQTGVIGTLHYKIGKREIPSINTTPEAVSLQRYYKEMVDEKCSDIIIEASSHALALGRLWYTDVDCAIFTNLTREHLDFHKTMDQYAYAKSLLFAQLGQNFHQGKPRLAIVNQDDPYANVMAKATSAELVTYSMKDKNATVYADHVHLEGAIQRFNLHFKNKTFQVSLSMIGAYNVMNFMAAFLCLTMYYGYSADQIVNLTHKLQGIPGRMQVIDKGQNYRVVIDFAHTPDALENVLSELKEDSQGKLRVLFGHSGGNRDSAARPDLGDILFNWSDELVFTADNPRHEPVRKIVSEMVRDHEEIPYILIEDRKEAIRYMINQAEEGDTLLFAGKGGEAYQVIGDEYLPYNEIAIVEEELENKWKI